MGCEMDPLLITGVFMIGMAVGALLMKIRLMDVVATVVSQQQANPSNDSR